MAVSRKTLESVAHLSRLALSEDEYAVYSKQLSAVLDAMEQLNGVTTADVPAADLPPLPADAARADQPRSRGEADAILSNAPDHTSRAFKLPGGMFSP